MPNLPASAFPVSDSLSPPRWPLRRVLALVLCGLSTAVAASGSFVHHGHFKRMMHSGDTTGKVALQALPQGGGQWGVGATAGLRGEIVQIDGRLWVSPGSDPQGRIRAPEPQEEALLFAGAPVAAWQAVPLPRDLDAAGFEAFLLEQARTVGLATEQPFVFRVEGRFPHLLWHVVTGEPPAAAGEPGAHGGHGGHGAAAGGHANARSDMRLYRQPGAAGQLVGVYSGAALEGVVSHPGERLHLHYVDAAQTVSGHVDRFSIAAGSVLRLPVGPGQAPSASTSR